MLRRRILVSLVALLVCCSFSASSFAKESEAKNPKLPMEVPGPVGPDLSTPPLKIDVPRTVVGNPNPEDADIQAGSMIHEYTWLGKSDLPERWDFKRTVIAVICDASNTRPCSGSHTESSTTTGGFTANIQFDVKIIKANTGFNINTSKTSSNTWTVTADPGWTGYIDIYNVYSQVQWQGRHDTYWVYCDPITGFCTKTLIGSETGGGTAWGTNQFLGGRIYVRQGYPPGYPG